MLRKAVLRQDEEKRPDCGAFSFYLFPSRTSSRTRIRCLRRFVGICRALLRFNFVQPHIYLPPYLKDNIHQINNTLYSCRSLLTWGFEPWLRDCCCMLKGRNFRRAWMSSSKYFCAASACARRLTGNRRLCRRFVRRLYYLNTVSKLTGYVYCRGRSRYKKNLTRYRRMKE